MRKSTVNTDDDNTKLEGKI